MAKFDTVEMHDGVTRVP